MHYHNAHFIFQRYFRDNNNNGCNTSSDAHLYNALHANGGLCIGICQCTKQSVELLGRSLVLVGNGLANNGSGDHL
jgi:hypothetical protein